MIKFWTLIAALFALISLSAAPVGNTSAPNLIQKGFFISSESWANFRAGYEGDFVADGRMKQFDQGNGRVDTYQQDTNSGTFTVNLVDRIDLYGVFGASQAKADWRFTNPGSGEISRIEGETKECFLWAVGGRAILCEWGKTSLGVGGRYSSCQYQPEWLTANGIVQSLGQGKWQWDEWQVNLDVSYKIDLFTPYIGTKYSNSRAYLKDFPVAISSDLTGSNSFENRMPFGLYVGCSLSSGNYFMLNLEGRLVDEEAVTVSAEFRF